MSVPNRPNEDYPDPAATANIENLWPHPDVPGTSARDVAGTQWTPRRKRGVSGARVHVKFIAAIQFIMSMTKRTMSLETASLVSPTKRKLSWSNLAVGADVIIFQVMTLGHPMEVMKMYVATNRNASLREAVRLTWSKGGGVGKHFIKD